MTTTPLVFIDTETTGIHPDREVWEVAMIRRDPDGGELAHRMFIDIDLDKADPFALKIGGFYQRHPMGRWLSTPPRPAAGGADRMPLDVGESQLSAAYVVARMTHGAHLVGVNPGFDAENLERLLRSKGLIPEWHYHLIDVLPMAAGYLNGLVAGAVHERQARVANLWDLGVSGADAPPQPGAALQPPWKSDDVAARLGIEAPTDDERHTALGDAKWAMRIYDAITKESR